MSTIQTFYATKDEVLFPALYNSTRILAEGKFRFNNVTLITNEGKDTFAFVNDDIIILGALNELTLDNVLDLRQNEVNPHTHRATNIMISYICGKRDNQESIK